MKIEELQNELRKLGLGEGQLAEVKPDSRYIFLISSSMSETMMGFIRKFMKREFPNVVAITGVDAKLFEIKQ